MSIYIYCISIIKRKKVIRIYKLKLIRIIQITIKKKLINRKIKEETSDL